MSGSEHGEPPPVEETIDWTRVLEYWPTFESPDFTAGSWRTVDRVGDGPIQFPWVEYTPVVLDFLETLDREGVILGFDWPTWVTGPGAQLAEIPKSCNAPRSPTSSDS